jgi:hypothetical protein
VAHHLITEIDTELSQLGRDITRIDQRICLLSLGAIAHHIHAVFPEATSLCLEWSDQGPYLVPDAVYAKDRRLSNLPESASGTLPADVLYDTIAPYCSNLDEGNQSVWEPFTTDIDPATGTVTPSSWRWLGLDQAPSIAAGC